MTLPPGRLRACDEADPDRVGARFKDDRCRRGRRLCRKCARRTRRGNHSHLTMNQIGHHCWQPIVLAVRPAVFDRHAVAIDVTGFAQPCEKGRKFSRVILRRLGVEKPDHRRPRLLRAHYQGPYDYCAAERGYKLPPSDCHLICPGRDHNRCD